MKDKYSLQHSRTMCCHLSTTVHHVQFVFQRYSRRHHHAERLNTKYRQTPTDQRTTVSSQRALLLCAATQGVRETKECKTTKKQPTEAEASFRDGVRLLCREQTYKVASFSFISWAFSSSSAFSWELPKTFFLLHIRDRRTQLVLKMLSSEIL